MTNISNFLKTLLAVLILGLPLFYIFFRGNQEMTEKALIDSVLANDVKLSKAMQKQKDSLVIIINQQQKKIQEYEDRLKATSKRTDSLRYLYDNIIVDRPKY